MEDFELTVTERVGKVTWWLADGEGLTIDNVCSLTGVSPRAARRMLCMLSRVLPIYDDECGVWQRCEMMEADVP